MPYHDICRKQSETTPWLHQLLIVSTLDSQLKSLLLQRIVESPVLSSRVNFTNLSTNSKMTEPTSRPMTIRGPYENERARLDGTMTDLDREWRKKWLKAQELGHHEPRTQFSASQMEMNPIRRAYRFPLDFVFSKLQSRLVSNNKY
jgi:hypothetical protein